MNTTITLAEAREMRAALTTLRAWFDGFEAAHAGRRSDVPTGPDALLDLSRLVGRVEANALRAAAEAEAAAEPVATSTRTSRFINREGV